MPELPEVEAAAVKLGRWTVGRVVQRLEILDPRVLAAGEADDLAGHTAIRAWRRAKYIVLDLDPLALVIHLRMTGKLVVGEPSRPPRARIHLADRVVSFEDYRRFGQLRVLAAEDLEAFFAGKRLGPEPWPMARDGAWWAARLKGLTGPIKPALLKQERVAGLGNIAASEILWRAGVDPAAKVPALSAEQWAAVAAAAPAHLALALEDAMQEDFVYLSESRAASNPFRVYGREGEPCPRCEAPIARAAQSGRATFWCAGCQSL